MSTSVVIPQSQSDAEGDQIVQEHHTLRNELTTLQADLSHATEEGKTALQTKISATKTKMLDASKRAQAKAAGVEQEAGAKIKALEQERTQASGDAKVKIDARIAEVRADYDRRAAKLKQAHESTKEALAR